MFPSCCTRTLLGCHGIMRLRQCSGTHGAGVPVIGKSFLYLHNGAIPSARRVLPETRVGFHCLGLLPTPARGTAPGAPGGGGCHTFHSAFPGRAFHGRWKSAAAVFQRGSDAALGCSNHSFGAKNHWRAANHEFIQAGANPRRYREDRCLHECSAFHPA